MSKSEAEEILYTFRSTTSNQNEIQSTCYFGDEAKEKIEQYTNAECVVVGYEKTGQEVSE